MAETAKLAARFAQPDGWQWREKFDVREGQYIRYGWVSPPSPRAAVIIMPGLSEYCEKYFEVISDLLQRNIAVACVDWRGQGLAWRPGDRMRRTHDDFAQDVEDAFTYLDALPFPAGLPRILLAHSMGGHIALRVLNTRPGAFACAVLTAPMIGLSVPEWLAGNVANIMHAAGHGDSYMPGHTAWSPARMENSLRILTSDPQRRAMQSFWMSAKPDLQMGGITASWVRAALASINIVRSPAYLRAIQTPILVFKAGREVLVSNPAIEMAVANLPNAEIERVEGAMHEVMMEQDIYRNRFWARFDGFIAKHTPAQ